MDEEAESFYRQANGTKISRTCELRGIEQIDIGAKSYIAENVLLDATHGPIRIGDRTYIGPGTSIVVAPLSDAQANTKEKTQCMIGDGVWVGDRVRMINTWVGPGARIGMDARLDRNTVIQERACVENASWVTESTTVQNYSLFTYTNANACDKQD